MRECVEHIKDTTQGKRIEIFAVLDEPGIYLLSLKKLPVRILLQNDGKGPIPAWNYGLSKCKGEIIILGADDLLFKQGWFEAMMEGFKKGQFVGLTYYTDNRGTWATHYAMTREYLIKHNGGVLACPAYHHQYIDKEGVDRAVRAGEYVVIEELVQHLHPMLGTAPWDETYKDGCLAWADADKEIFERRRAQGWPDDFESILKEE